MTTRYDLIRDNLLSAVDACVVSELVTDQEARQLRTAVDELVDEMESYNE